MSQITDFHYTLNFTDNRAAPKLEVLALSLISAAVRRDHMLFFSYGSIRIIRTLDVLTSSSLMPEEISAFLHGESVNIDRAIKVPSCSESNPEAAVRTLKDWMSSPAEKIVYSERYSKPIKIFVDDVRFSDDTEPEGEVTIIQLRCRFKFDDRLVNSPATLHRLIASLTPGINAFKIVSIKSAITVLLLRLTLANYIRDVFFNQNCVYMYVEASALPSYAQSNLTFAKKFLSRVYDQVSADGLPPMWGSPLKLLRSSNGEMDHLLTKLIAAIKLATGRAGDMDPVVIKSRGLYTRDLMRHSASGSSQTLIQNFKSARDLIEIYLNLQEDSSPSSTDGELFGI